MTATLHEVPIEVTSAADLVAELVRRADAATAAARAAEALIAGANDYARSQAVDAERYRMLCSFDPFARTDVHLGWRDLLHGLVRRRLTVTVIIGGETDRMNDVLELDDNTLLPNSTRRQAWNSHVSETLGRME
jgi:hypothetical protein